MPLIPFSLLFLLSLIVPSIASAAAYDGDGSIIFATLGSKSSYAFDIYTLPAGAAAPQDPGNAVADELQLTDSLSINFNGNFPRHPSSSSSSSSSINILYVTERNGSSKIYLDTVTYNKKEGSSSSSSVINSRARVPLVSGDDKDGGGRGTPSVYSFKDRPSLAPDGDHLIYVSTHEDSGVPRASWAAVYSTHLPTASTRRLTPYGVADFSPAVSPSGEWTAVASYGEQGWNDDVEELATHIYAFRTRDGSGRVMVVSHGGWPTWQDDYTLFFHRRDGGPDGWWAVYRAIFPERGPADAAAVRIERLTPPGMHAFTPAASPGNKSFIAVATRRPGSDFRHIELLDLKTNEFRELTRRVSPRTHHFNPFISPDSTLVGYHRCRGKSPRLFLENLRSPAPEISLFRIDGSFPSFSPGGDRVAFVQFPGLYVANRDGSNQREVFRGTAFSTAWDRVRKGVVYTSAGPTFASESAEVDIISVNVDDDRLRGNCYKKLTVGGQNNAFPAPSPDGKWVVFRSGRTVYKNLYVMDAVDGERGGIRRLTEGPWTDTMCSWSPDGNWIAFASDRENPGGGSFGLYLIHPNGTGLRKLFESGSVGRANHPSFSPDGKRITFTSDYAGVSAEPISNPHHYQPYGEIFTMRLDGSDLRRLTHNSFEDGTPAWGPKYIQPADVEQPKPNRGPLCSFEDCHWLTISAPYRDGIYNGAPFSLAKRQQCAQA